MTPATITFLLAALLMLIDAIGYTFGAIRPIRKGLAPSDAYWDRRLLLNLMLANAGLYFTSLFTFAGAYVRERELHSGNVLAGLSLAICAYSLVTVVAFTPSDWKHAIPRTIAAVLLVATLAL